MGSICSQSPGELDNGVKGSYNEDRALLPLKSLTAEARTKVSSFYDFFPFVKGSGLNARQAQLAGVSAMLLCTQR